MQPQPEQKYTIEEYFEFEVSSEEKHEFYQGEIFAFAGASISHNRITRNITSSLDHVFKKSNCEVFMSDMRVWVQSQDMFTYPDVLIICGDIAYYPGRNDTISNPQVIIEVLSHSTKNYDHGEKFRFYRMIPSFSEYILVDQESVQVEHYVKEKHHQWMFTELNSLDQKLMFKTVDAEIPLSEIYARVEFETADR